MRGHTGRTLRRLVEIGRSVALVRLAVVWTLVTDHARTRPFVDVLPDGRLRESALLGSEKWFSAVVVHDVRPTVLDVVVDDLANFGGNTYLSLALPTVLDGGVGFWSVYDLEVRLLGVAVIILDVEGVLKSSHLFKPFPDEMQDLALIDRFHYYLPGWEIPKMRSEYFDDQFGFIVDYFSEVMRELRKETHGDAINEYFALGSHLNQRDEKAVRKTVSGFLKMLHPHGEYTKEEVREYLEFAMEGRRRVKEQLKRMGGMEYRAVNFSYIDMDTREEVFVTVPEEAEETLIPQGSQQPGTVYTIGNAESQNAVFRVETQSLPGKGKKSISGTPGSGMKDEFETSYDYLKANMRKLSRDESLDDHDIKVQVLNPSDASEGTATSVGFLVAIISSILDRPVRPRFVVLGSMSLMGELVEASSLVDKLQLAVDSGANTVLLPAKNKESFGKIPDEILEELELLFYTDPIEAASKALQLE